MSCSDNLKSLRKQRGLTQMQLATELNVSLSVVALIESGARNPSRGMVKKLSQFFNVPAENFISDDMIIKTQIDPELLVDIIDAIDEFLSENCLTMSPDQRKQLVKHFSERNYQDPIRIKEILSGMLAINSAVFTRKDR